MADDYFSRAGGYVYDPANGIDGEVRDIWIAGRQDRRAADRSDACGPTRTLDAAGLVVMPGGIDMHCHIAGPKVNVARKMRPEEKRKRRNGRTAPPTRTAARWAACPARSPPATSTPAWATPPPSTPPMPPLGRPARPRGVRRHALHRQGLLRPDGQQPLRHAVRSSENEPREAEGVHRPGCSAPTKGYAAKLVNPGRRRGLEAASRRATCTGSTQRVDHFDVTPRQIIRGVAQAADELRLPHPVHIHCNNLGMPGNWTTTLETMKALEGHRGHITHIQFHSYGGGDGDENTFNSQGRAAGRVRERPPEHHGRRRPGDVRRNDQHDRRRPAGLLPAQGLRNASGSAATRRWSPAAASRRSSTSNKSLVHALQWAIGLEWYLLVEDPWRVVMSTDHPNGGSFLAYPQIIRLLMDRTYRQDVLKTRPSAGARALDAGRPGPRVLAERDRHHHPRRPGQDPGPEEQGPSRPRRRCRHHDLHAAREQGDDVRAAALRDQVGPRSSSKRARSASRSIGKTLHVAPEYDRDVEADIADWFEKYYSMRFRNYPVSDSYMQEAEQIPCATRCKGEGRGAGGEGREREAGSGPITRSFRVSCRSL